MPGIGMFALVVTVPTLDGNFVAYGRFVPTMAGQSDVKYVGDAAMAFDPLASEGIAKALNGGRRAAASIAAYLAGDASSLCICY